MATRTFEDAQNEAYGATHPGRRPAAECNCWVARESEEVRFGIRFGAHCDRPGWRNGPQPCPQYRPSQDPVDAANDRDLHDRSCLEVDGGFDRC